MLYELDKINKSIIYIRVCELNEFLGGDKINKSILTYNIYKYTNVYIYKIYEYT